VSEWFERWFGEEYLHAYPHRDDEEAERLVALLEARGIGVAGRRVLDLACGAGRHAAALRRRGARVVGLDLSAPLLARARERGACGLVRGDMRRLPFGARTFDAVLNLFTSFGYFATDDEHARVVSEVGRVLRSGGRFVLDFLNAPAVRSGLVARDETCCGEATLVQQRSISADGRFVVKTIRMSGEGRTFTERVRLLERREIEAMLRAAGIRTEAAVGGYDGAEHGAASPRLILVGRRE